MVPYLSKPFFDAFGRMVDECQGAYNILLFKMFTEKTGWRYDDLH